MTDYKIPKTMGACADRWFKVRAMRLEMDKKSKELKAEETALANHLIENLPASDASGIQGRTVRVSINRKTVYNVKDQEALRKWCARHRRWDILNKLAVSAPAVRELAEDGKKVPGIEAFNTKTLSFSSL